MIDLLSIEDFKSYQKATLRLGPLTLFIGANASGKSNALEAIRLLSWLANGSRLDDIERNIQGADSLVRGKATDLFRHGGKQTRIGCHLSAPPDGWNGLVAEFGIIGGHLVLTGEEVTHIFENLPLYRIDSEPRSHTDEVSVMYNNFARGGNKPHIPCSNRQAIFYQLQTPGRFDKKHVKSQEVIPRVTKGIRKALQDVLFLDPRPAVMRDYVHSRVDKLKEDGSNVSGALYDICRKKGGDAEGAGKAALLEFIRSLPEQDITDIKFIETDRGDVMVRLEESFGGRRELVDAPLLSDGTLRVLAVAAALWSAAKGSLVIIEEIDNGVHPGRADQLIAEIRAVAQKRDLRVLLTSHNPALLDALPPEALEDVLCCYRDPAEGDSRVVRLGELDRYPELVAQGPLGQLMTKRVLERFVKDPTTADQRRQQQLEWLHSIAKEEAEE